MPKSTVARPKALDAATELRRLEQALVRPPKTSAQRENLRLRALDLQARLTADQGRVQALLASVGEPSAPPVTVAVAAAPQARGIPGPGELRPRDTPAAGGPGRRFADFLGEVGQAMAQAQRQLDGESASYARTATGQVVPSLFRLPRLNAQMKFALEATQQKGLNLLFVSRESQKEERYEHTLEFEVVAVPPPPGTPATPLGAPLADPEARRQILAPLLERADFPDRLGLPPGAAVAAEQDRILVWPLPTDGLPEGGDLWLLGYAAPDRTVASLHLLLRRAAGADPLTLLPAGAPAGAATLAFAQMAARVGNAQAGR